MCLTPILQNHLVKQEQSVQVKRMSGMEIPGVQNSSNRNGSEEMKNEQSSRMTFGMPLGMLSYNLLQVLQNSTSYKSKCRLHKSLTRGSWESTKILSGNRYSFLRFYLVLTIQPQAIIVYTKCTAKTGISLMDCKVSLSKFPSPCQKLRQEYVSFVLQRC